VKGVIPVQSRWFPVVLIAIGFLLRLWMAHAFFLNPDEAYHYLLSAEPSLRLVYQASLTTAHPPLYLVLLHYWALLGNSEFVLRMLSLGASMGFYWLAFLWVCRALDRNVAVMVLALLLFSPPLISISWEIRQYAILWFFAMGGLYSLECGVENRSVPWMALSAASLWLALVTHYSSLILAVGTGVYAALRLWQTKNRLPVIAVWAAGQGIGLALGAFLLKTHVAMLRNRGVTQALADTYVRKSMFHPGEEGLLHFIARANIRLFHYFFAQGAVGVVGLLLFVAGLVILLRAHTDPETRRRRQALACLLGLPFVLNCAMAIYGLFPYGGTRQNSYLALFAMTGIAAAASAWNVRKWVPTAALAAVLLLVNLFPSVMGERFRREDHTRQHMTEAIADLRGSLAPGSVIFTDEQGRFVLSYYLCRSNRLPYGGIEPPFVEATCSDYRMISIRPSKWIFDAADFPQEVRGLGETFRLEPATQVWFFQAGWSVDDEPGLRALLPRYGCVQPREFGRNIVQCPISLAESRVSE